MDEILQHPYAETQLTTAREDRVFSSSKSIAQKRRHEYRKRLNEMGIAANTLTNQAAAAQYTFSSADTSTATTTTTNTTSTSRKLSKTSAQRRNDSRLASALNDTDFVMVEVCQSIQFRDQHWW